GQFLAILQSLRCALVIREQRRDGREMSCAERGNADKQRESLADNSVGQADHDARSDVTFTEILNVSSPSLPLSTTGESRAGSRKPGVRASKPTSCAAEG